MQDSQDEYNRRQVLVYPVRLSKPKDEQEDVYENDPNDDWNQGAADAIHRPYR